MSLWLFSLTRIFTILFCVGTSMAHNFSAIYIFGDSLVDVGNNNYIKTLCKANYKPEGIDFGKPTGRFTNGRTVMDLIGESLGFKTFPPPYMAPTTVGPVVMQLGVNYGSGASGILDGTGANFIGRISMDAQIRNFGKTRGYIISRIGARAASKLFATALFTVTMGSNDFINNYFLLSKSHMQPPETFTRTMITTFHRQLTTLYFMGARHFVITNVPPIGCTPNERDTHPSSGQKCVASQNHVAQLYNHQLKQMLKQLTNRLKGSTFVYADVYHILGDIIQNYTSYGFEVPDGACCHTLGPHGGLLPCLQHVKLCPDRSKYIFWDWFHATESTNVIVAKRILDGDSSDVSPINVRKLSQVSTIY